MVHTYVPILYPFGTSYPYTHPPHSHSALPPPPSPHSRRARAGLLAVRRGLEVLGRFVAGDRLLETREFDDDEAVEFLRALEDLELAAAGQKLAAELFEDAWY